MPITPTGPGYAVAPLFAVRVGAVPVGALAALRCTGTWELVEELAETEQRLARDGATLSDPLHAAIGAVAGHAAKPALVALRRAVFAGRRPDRRSIAPETLAALPVHLAGSVRAWLARREHLDVLRARLPQVHAAEAAEKTELLRAAAATEAFRRALAQGSPVLSARTDAWLAGEQDRTPQRQELIRLTRYVARAAVKTSPYASFTLSGFGEWAQSGPAVQPADTLVWRGVAELDRAVLQPLWAAVTRRPELHRRARLRVNPTAADDGARIRFLGAAPAEPLRSVPATDAVRAVLARVRAHADVTAADLPQARALIDAGLLELVPPYDEQGEDPVGQLADWIAECGEPGAAAVGAAARRVAEAQSGGPVADRVTDRAMDRTTDHAAAAAPAESQRRRIDTVRQALEEIFAPEPRANPWLPDKNLCLETAVLADSAGRCEAASWQGVFDDLDAIRRALGLFDPDLPVKIAGAAFFLERYGAAGSVSVLEFYRDVHAADQAGPAATLLRGLLRDPLAPPTAAHDAPLPGLRALAQARARFWAAVDAGPASDGPAVTRVQPGLLADLAADWPAFVRPPGSVCCYVQATSGNGGPHAVLGLVTAGYGRGLSRLHRMASRAGGQVPAADGLRAPGRSARVVECRGILNGGLNLRTAVADAALRYPGTHHGSALPELDPTELVVTYDDRAQRLALRDAQGRPVLPVHLGMAAQHWLPPALQFLVRAFGEPAAAMTPGWVFRAGGRLPAPGAVERRPRLDVGRVTLARACVRLRAGDFPLAAVGEPETAYLPRLAVWLREHGLGRRFFARVIDSGDGPGSGLMGKGRKPVYVDVENDLLLAGFLRTVRDRQALMVLEEALPDPGDAPRYGEHGPRVTEYIFQISGTQADS
ncbi:MAG: hypothetical protein HOV87_16070 [Catenulispora sp.]|nr:hypothetical protein [Catenulispora sp.]